MTNSSIAAAICDHDRYDIQRQCPTIPILHTFWLNIVVFALLLGWPVEHFNIGGRSSDPDRSVAVTKILRYLQSSQDCWWDGSQIKIIQFFYRKKSFARICYKVLLAQFPSKTMDTMNISRPRLFFFVTLRHLQRLNHELRWSICHLTSMKLNSEPQSLICWSILRSPLLLST